MLFSFLCCLRWRHLRLRGSEANLNDNRAIGIRDKAPTCKEFRRVILPAFNDNHCPAHCCFGMGGHFQIRICFGTGDKYIPRSGSFSRRQLDQSQHTEWLDELRGILGLAMYMAARWGQDPHSRKKPEKPTAQHLREKAINVHPSFHAQHSPARRQFESSFWFAVIFLSLDSRSNSTTVPNRLNERMIANRFWVINTCRKLWHVHSYSIWRIRIHSPDLFRNENFVKSWKIFSLISICLLRRKETEIIGKIKQLERNTNNSL